MFFQKWLFPLVLKLVMWKLWLATFYSVIFIEMRKILNIWQDFLLQANYNPEIICLMRQFGCWAIAVSGFEVTLAIQRGICPENIILNGNGKQIWEIEIAVKNGCLINVDSIFDLQNILKVTQKLDKKVQVLIRLNPDINAVWMSRILIFSKNFELRYI